MKLPGAILILSGAFGAFWLDLHSQRRKLALIRDLSAALDQMAGEIRWRLTPLPDAICTAADREISGKLFRSVYENLQGGFTLQDAWQQVFSALATEIGGIMLRMEWGGDMQRQEGSLRYASRQLLELGERRCSELRQREKLCAAAALSAAGLLVLILI